MLSLAQVARQLRRVNVSVAVRSRAVSTFDGSGDDDQELSPLERLLQHSQQFQVENDTKQDEESPFSDSWQADSIKSTSRSSGAFARNTFRRRGNSTRHLELGKLAVGHVTRKETDEIDYDSELESVWGEDQLKQRKFHQALRREQDRDHVCTNCGEPGHRARNCLIPRICSNCGNLGHTNKQCRYRKTPESIDEFLQQEEHLQEKRKKSRKLKKKAARAFNDPQLPRPEGLPTSDFNKRNESLRQELDAELDAYADMLEEKSRKRKEKRNEK
ncbi:hypothetical protein PHMEG_0003135 [Phytophthora megakarya]|uniref:CCHC-type domain-containing protein n=1 Tax=Phytophthora megakarya TaxID=4795 RepID=A0A225WYR6_9STRA|nr:hypothetical protein PHMEG_0003135 [Phytophthora megakarya]